MPAARERILSVACELFYREGIRAVGIDRIIAEAEVAKASLYANFKSKDDLIVAYLNSLCETWQAEVNARLADADDPADAIRRLFKMVAEDFKDSAFRGCPFSNAATEFPDATHPSRQVTTEYRAWLRNRLQELATAAHLKNPRAVATALMMLYDGACVSAKLDDHRSVRKATLAAVDDVIVRARPTTSAGGP
jgi:AcrR family transcriptional regulator